jgi:polyhydroxyalkanoate synthase subunit PhaC
VATTPGKVVYQNDLMQLIQYAPATETVAASARSSSCRRGSTSSTFSTSPPQKSFVGWAVAQGLTVFVISWVNPDGRLAMKSFADYMRHGVLAALERHRAGNGVARGQWRWATASAARCWPQPWATWPQAMTTGCASSATLIGAQVDFEEAGDLLVFIDEEQVRRP